MAIIYANECAEVRKLARTAISSGLALEQAVLRLQTIDKLGDVLVTIAPIVEIVEETKGRLVGTIPSVANRLNEINSVLKSSFSEMSSTRGFKEASNDSGEAIKILNEANLAAEEKIKERFPSLPEELTCEKVAEFRIPVALAATGGELEMEDKNPLKQQVYEYMKACGGQFSLTRCAAFLEAPPEAVETVLSKLKEEGRIAPK